MHRIRASRGAARRRSPCHGPCRQDAGFVSLEFALGIGVLVLPMALLVLTFPTWIERQSAARIGAQEAARVIVLADDVARGADAGRAIVAQTARNHAIPVDQVDVCWSVHWLGSPDPPTCTGLAEVPRGAVVTAYVTVRLPALAFPGLGVVLAPTAYTARHTERTDLYRSS